MSKKIEIASGCMACGLCLNSPYIEELPDGMAKVKGTGIVASAEEKAILQMIGDCPARVISLKEVLSKSKEEISALMKQEAEKFSVPIPPMDEIALEERHMDIHAPLGVPGQVYTQREKFYELSYSN